MLTACQCAGACSSTLRCSAHLAIDGRLITASSAHSTLESADAVAPVANLTFDTAAELKNMTKQTRPEREKLTCGECGHSDAAADAAAQAECASSPDLLDVTGLLQTTCRLHPRCLGSVRAAGGGRSSCILQPWRGRGDGRPARCYAADS